MIYSNHEINVYRHFRILFRLNKFFLNLTLHVLPLSSLMQPNGQNGHPDTSYSGLPFPFPPSDPQDSAITSFLVGSFFSLWSSLTISLRPFLISFVYMYSFFCLPSLSIQWPIIFSFFYLQIYPLPFFWWISVSCGFSRVRSPSLLSKFVTGLLTHLLSSNSSVYLCDFFCLWN